MCLKAAGIEPVSQAWKAWVITIIRCPHKKSNITGEKKGKWWRGKDSNLRRQSRQIYSLIPLATREPLHSQPVSGLTTVLSFDSGDYDIQTLLIMQEKILIFFIFFTNWLIFRILFITSIAIFLNI